VSQHKFEHTGDMFHVTNGSMTVTLRRQHCRTDC